MPTALNRYFLALLLLLPFGTHAGDADDFLAANPAQQAKLLQDWAAQPTRRASSWWTPCNKAN
jgi:urea transport system permease protein